MAEYQTKEGDVLEQIAFKQYGRSSAVIEVLEANRTLALSNYPGKLPAGLVITLPDLTAPSVESVKLWN